MTNKTALCNMALARLGGQQLTNFDSDTTSEANLCRAFFDYIIDEVIMEGSWTTCARRAALVQLSSTPAFEYTYEYQLPTDPYCLKVLEFYEGDWLPGSTSYAIEGRKLLTNATTAKIRYLARLDDPYDWGPMLQRAFVARLTAELAMPLTGNSSRVQEALAMYERWLELGLANDNQQGAKEEIVYHDLTDPR